MSVEFGNRLHLFACRLQAMAVWMASAKGKLLMKRQTYATNSSQYNAHVFLALERSIERGALPGNTAVCKCQGWKAETGGDLWSQLISNRWDLRVFKRKRGG